MLIEGGRVISAGVCTQDPITSEHVCGCEDGDQLLYDTCVPETSSRSIFLHPAIVHLVYFLDLLCLSAHYVCLLVMFMGYLLEAITEASSM